MGHSKQRKADAMWLKSWFDLARYPKDDLKKFGADSWGQQFEIRRQLLHRIEIPKLFENEPSIRDWCLKQLREAPLTIGCVRPRIITRPPVMDMAHEEVRAQSWLYDQPGLKDMVGSWDAENGALDLAARVLKNGVKRGGMRGLSAHHELLEAIKEPVEGGADANVERVLQVGYAGIDFSFSDDVLKEHFGRWLEKKRASFQAAGIQMLAHAKDQSSSKKPRVILNESSMAKWISQQVLPYLDIRIMTAEEGFDMPPAKVLADTLFSDLHANGGDEKVKISQRLKPLAERLIEPSVIERLILDGQACRIGSKN